MDRWIDGEVVKTCVGRTCGAACKVVKALVLPADDATNRRDTMFFFIRRTGTALRSDTLARVVSSRLASTQKLVFFSCPSPHPRAGADDLAKLALAG